MQVLNIIDYFTQLATLHSQIESFKTGDVWEVAIAGEDIYPQLWLDQIFNYQENRGVCNWNVSFMILAKQLQDESNENTQLDLAHTIGLEVIEKIKQDNLYQINDQFNAVSFTEAFEDFLCGWRFEIELSTVNNINRCAIPGYTQELCTYKASITAESNTSVVGIITTAGPLSLPSLPIPISTLNGAGLAAAAANLEADLASLGYQAIVSSATFPFSTITVEIRQTNDTFLCLMGDAENSIFVVNCQCTYRVEVQEAPFNDKIIAIAEAPTLSPTGLPFSFGFGNPNFDSDKNTLITNYLSLGVVMEINDISPPAATFRTIEIIVTSSPSVFISISTKVNYLFIYNCIT